MNLKPNVLKHKNNLTTAIDKKWKSIGWTIALTLLFVPFFAQESIANESEIPTTAATIIVESGSKHATLSEVAPTPVNDAIIQDLKKQIAEAVDNEDYALAGTLKEELKKKRAQKKQSETLNNLNADNEESGKVTKETSKVLDYEITTIVSRGESLWDIFVSAFKGLKLKIRDLFNWLKDFGSSYLQHMYTRILLFLLLYSFAWVYIKRSGRDLNLPEGLLNPSSSADGIVSRLVILVGNGAKLVLRPFWFVYDVIEQYIYPTLYSFSKLVYKHVISSGFMYFGQVLFLLFAVLPYRLLVMVVGLIGKLFRPDILLISLATLTLAILMNYFDLALIGLEENDSLTTYLGHVFQMLSFLVLALGMALVQFRFLDKIEKRPIKGFGSIWLLFMRLFLPAVLLVVVQAGLFGLILHTDYKWLLTPVVTLFGFGFSVFAFFNYLLLILAVPALVGFCYHGKRFSWKEFGIFSLKLIPQYVIALPLGALVYSALSVLPLTVSYSSAKLTTDILENINENKQSDLDGVIKRLNAYESIEDWGKVNVVSDDSLNTCFQGYRLLMDTRHKKHELKQMTDRVVNGLSKIPNNKIVSPAGTFGDQLSKWYNLTEQRKTITDSVPFLTGSIASDLDVAKDNLETDERDLKDIEHRISEKKGMVNAAEIELSNICSEVLNRPVTESPVEEVVRDNYQMTQCETEREKKRTEIEGLNDQVRQLEVYLQSKIDQQERDKEIAGFISEINNRYSVSKKLASRSEGWFNLGMSFVLSLIMAIGLLFFFAGFATFSAAISVADWNNWYNKFSENNNRVRQIDERNPVLGILLSIVSVYVLSLMFDFDAADWTVKFFQAVYHDVSGVYFFCWELVQELRNVIIDVLST